ncbi:MULTISPECIES: HAMP domain-containing sensor histidine kinase [unclassified Paenibacillus]|uniref:sensor histidine kinase n=1 Tax=unclassified Paenibacillus TaxID=185978 RepID=UPI001AE92414|nr:MULTISPECIES: HAMP domain-containing sensor histidine kinase [unclassified Paenibacillus]MBP1156475.1 signal transduction histidine kinase [Paenibacillus sp. PvP091]MBP1168139.1 signal transduction histidine kinase [Paenibacillus sp. PvR098]MBP2439167.1 signal transduction histidine kinase [Paenibacillus sp. PvP052]
MKWNRIGFKLALTFIFMFAAVLLPVGYVTQQIFTGFHIRHVQEEIDQTALQYANTLSSSVNNEAYRMIEMMAKFSDEKMFIVDATGRIELSTGMPMIPAGYSIPADSLQVLISKEPLRVEYMEPSSGERYLVAGSGIFNKDLFRGGVLVLSSASELDKSLRQVQYLLIFAGIGAFFLALAITFVVTKKLSVPLIQMGRATNKIAKGELETRVTISSGDEIGALAHSINQMASNLKHYDDTRKQFFANISHDLRTPVAYIKGYAEVLKEGMVHTDGEREKIAGLIYAESDRIVHLIEDIFQLARMDEGKIELVFEWVDMVDLLENVVDKYKSITEKKGILLNVSAEGEIPLLYADGLRMEQIISNLLDNAVRYTSDGEIHAAVKASDHCIVITIQDTGIGIPNEDLSYIFDRFYRGDKSRSQEIGGTGLGLFIVKKLTEMQGGKVSVSSQPGYGTTFQLTFLAQEGES